MADHPVHNIYPVDAGRTVSDAAATARTQADAVAIAEVLHLVIDAVAEAIASVVTEAIVAGYAGKLLELATGPVAAPEAAVEVPQLHLVMDLEAVAGGAEGCTGAATEAFPNPLLPRLVVVEGGYVAGCQTTGAWSAPIILSQLLASPSEVAG